MYRDKFLLVSLIAFLLGTEPTVQDSSCVHPKLRCSNLPSILISAPLLKHDLPQENSSPRIINPLKFLPTRQEPPLERFLPYLLRPVTHLHPFQ